MFKFGVLIFLAFALAFALSSIVVERTDKECIRGDNKSGYFIPLKKCSFIYNMLLKRKRGSRLSHYNQMYLKRSNYERRHKKNFVCCEEREKIDEAIDNLFKEDCGRFEIDKIYGGRYVKLMSRPWMAILNLIDHKNQTYICGGTLINKRYVLTAAHCFDKKELSLLRLGEHNLRKKKDCDGDSCAPPVEDIEIERIFVHEKYSPKTLHDDIALVKLSRDVEFKRNISPICLPTTETLQQKVNNMKNFHVTGWGKTAHTNFSDTLMEIIVNQKNRAICKKRFPKHPIDSTQICAGADGKDACGGDSGGPLSQVVYFNEYQRFVQFGVVNFGSPHCDGTDPGVYTNVGSYIRWIAYTIATK